MAGLWLLCLLGVATTAVGSVLPADRANSPCQPGDVWTADDGCNTCFCVKNADGGMAACTLMECSARNPGDTRTSGGLGGESGMKPLPLPGMEPEWRSTSGSSNNNMKPLPLPKPEEVEAKPYDTDMKPEPKPVMGPNMVEERRGVSCTDGEEWYEDCNSCHCLGDGKAACTMMGCVSEGRVMAEAVKDNCEAGVTWSDECNVCHCLGDSQVVCSYKFCLDSETESRRRRRQTTCEEGTTSQVDCNTCICLSNGRQACTKKFCLPESSQQTGFSVSAKAGGSTSECKKECPQECATFRGEDGCLTCDCDTPPLWGVLPVPEERPAAAAAGDSWSYNPNENVDPGFAVNPGWVLG